MDQMKCQLTQSVMTIPACTKQLGFIPKYIHTMHLVWWGSTSGIPSPQDTAHFAYLHVEAKAFWVPQKPSQTTLECVPNIFGDTTPSVFHRWCDISLPITVTKKSYMKPSHATYFSQAYFCTLAQQDLKFLGKPHPHTDTPIDHVHDWHTHILPSPSHKNLT